MKKYVAVYFFIFYLILCNFVFASCYPIGGVGVGPYYNGSSCPGFSYVYGEHHNSCGSIACYGTCPDGQGGQRMPDSFAECLSCVGAYPSGYTDVYPVHYDSEGRHCTPYFEEHIISGSWYRFGICDSYTGEYCSVYCNDGSLPCHEVAHDWHSTYHSCICRTNTCPHKCSDGSDCPCSDGSQCHEYKFPTKPDSITGFCGCSCPLSAGISIGQKYYYSSHSVIGNQYSSSGGLEFHLGSTPPPPPPPPGPPGPPGP